MTLLSTKHMYDIAEWCQDRGMLPDRITGSDVKAACTSLGIANDGDFDLYQVKEIGSLYELE